MASQARSDKDGAGPDRPPRDTQDLGYTSSRKEAERQEGGQTAEQIQTQKAQGQRERERAGGGK